MNTQRVILALLTASGSILLGGCLLAAVGAGAAGTVAYVKGDLEATEPSKLDVVYEATKKALKDLELSITSDTKDALSATVVARDAQDKRATVKLSAVTENSTRISIRFGTFGDEAKSTMVYSKIKENLE